MPLWRRTKKPLLADLLPWDCLAAPAVVQLRDGALMACLHLAGPDLDSALDSELIAQAGALNQLARRFGAGWGLQADVRRWPVTGYPPATWPTWVSAALEDERQAQWAAGGHFTNIAHLTVVYKASQPAVRGWEKVVYENWPEDEAEVVTLADFVDEVQRLISMLKSASIGAEVLAEEPLLTYLHSTVSTNVHRVQVPQPTAYLNHYLTDQDLEPGIYPRLGGEDGVYLGCLRPHAWPRTTWPGMFQVLEDLEIEYRACRRYLPMDKAEAVHRAEKNANQWESKRKAGKDRSADDRADEAQEAWRRLENGEIGYGRPTTTVVVWDATVAGLKRKLQQVESTFQSLGMIVKREWLNTMDAWVGTLPGELVANCCTQPMSSLNLAHLFPATQPWPGQRANPHLGGGATFYATGVGRSSVGISLYEEDVGHFALIGSTGDGKSTFLNWLCTQMLRYKEQEICIFDLRYAALRLTAMMGGFWYDLGNTPLQPLAHLDEPGEIPWAVEWLEHVLLQERVHVTPAIKEEVYARLCTMAQWNRPRRTMDALAALVEDDQAKRAIRLYSTQGPYGATTGGDTDPIGDNKWLCFEMNTIWETPRLMNTVLPALFHQLERRLVGPPVFYPMHEGWMALSVPYWQDRLRGWLKGLRTRNGAVGLVSQSLANVAKAAIAEDIIDNMASWVFTPNPEAMSEENQKIYTRVGLNERECERLALAVKKRDYYLKQASGRSMIRLDLGPRAMATCATPYAGEIADLKAQIAMHGPDFARHYLSEKGLV